MRTLVTIFLAGVCLVGGPTLAQHPRVPGGMYARNLPNGDAPARAYGRIRSGDISGSSVWRTGKPAVDELYGDACHSSHAVFSCPGTP